MYRVVNKNLKSLNWIEHYEILDYLEKKEVNKIWLFVKSDWWVGYIRW